MTIVDRMSDARADEEYPEAVGHRIVLAAIDLLTWRSLHELTLEAVAEHAGLTLDEVAGQVTDVDELIVAAIGEWHRRRMAAVRVDAEESGAVALLRNLLELSLADPTCQRVVLAAAGISAIPGHPSAVLLRQQWVRFHASVQRALACDVETGREPVTMDPPSAAEQLLALYEGLQFQWLLRPQMDLLSSFDLAITRFRLGWSRANPPLH